MADSPIPPLSVAEMIDPDIANAAALFRETNAALHRPVVTSVKHTDACAANASGWMHDCDCGAWATFIEALPLPTFFSCDDCSDPYECAVGGGCSVEIAAREATS